MGNSAPERPRAEQLQVPPVERWNGQAYTIEVRVAKIPMTVGLGGVAESSMEFVERIIKHQDTAGAGFKLAAFFLPLSSAHSGPVDMEVDNILPGGARVAKAQAIFQVNPHETLRPVETIILKAPIIIESGVLSASRTTSGYDKLYERLHEAAGQGYELSAVMDEPDRKSAGFVSTETSVLLVCQRHQGEAVAQRQHVVVNVPIDLVSECNGCDDVWRASMPKLQPTLEEYGKDGHRLASIYNPPNKQSQSIGVATSSCHVIFEKAPVNYQFSVVDCTYTVKASGLANTTVDHTQYYQVIAKWRERGWQLAALVDMPDKFQEGCMGGSTVKLIFQAPI